MKGVQAVLAIDPGKMSGLSFWQVGHKTPLHSLELDFHETCKLSAKLMHAWGSRLVVVSESFIITKETAKKTPQTWSLEIIGVLRYFSWYYGCQFFLQTPSQAKMFATNEKLRRLDWWHVGGAGHANDAHRHLLTFVIQRRLLPVSDIASLIE